MISMKYTNEKVRRQDRLLEEQAASDLLKNGEYGVLSMQAEDGGAYGIPISYAWDGNNAIYLHCATEGRKLRLIVQCPKVSSCLTGKTNVLSAQFTTKYESIILDCMAHRQLQPEERMKALEHLIDKYSPADKAKGMKYAEKSFNKTDIIRLDIISWSGKSKRVK